MKKIIYIVFIFSLITTSLFSQHVSLDIGKMKISSKVEYQNKYVQTEFTFAFPFDLDDPKDLDWLFCPVNFSCTDTCSLESFRDPNRFFKSGLYAMSKNGCVFCLSNILPLYILDKLSCSSSHGYREYKANDSVVHIIKTNTSFIKHLKHYKLIFYYDYSPSQRFVFVSKKISGKE